MLLSAPPQVVVRKNPDAATDEERAGGSLVGTVEYQGSRAAAPAGSLVMLLPDSELGAVPSLLYGGVNGSVGLVASLPREWFEMLATLQEGLKKVRTAMLYEKSNLFKQFKIRSAGNCEKGGADVACQHL